MKKVLTPLHQLIGALSFAYAIHWQYAVCNIPEELSPTRLKFGGVFKYLTFLNMVLQFIFFTLAFFANFSEKNSRLGKAKDLVFSSAAFPFGMFVGIVFWSLWAVNRELILPARYDPYFPSWANHLMHTTVLPLQLGELILCHHSYPSRRLGGAITASLTFAYLVWINIIYYYGGFWVYPVFQVLTEAQRLVFMLVCSCFGVLLYIMGEAANNVIWGVTRKKPVD